MNCFVSLDLCDCDTEPPPRSDLVELLSLVVGSCMLDGSSQIIQLGLPILDPILLFQTLSFHYGPSRRYFFTLLGVLKVSIRNV